MTTQHSVPSSTPSSFAQRLQSAGIAHDDSEELRLNKSLLLLATGLICATMMVWAVIYSLLNQRFSIDTPVLFFLLLAGNMLLYFVINRFDFFRITQLGLILFLPFVGQWMAGNLIVSSGVVMWGLLAPIGAILCIGARESIGWFIAWGVLIVLSGGADYYLADTLSLQHMVVPLRTILLFFTLNFLSVAGISYALLLFSIEQRRKTQERLEKARQKLQVADEAAETLIRGPTIFI